MITQHNLRNEKPEHPWDVKCDRSNPVLGNHAGKGLPREAAIKAFTEWLANAYHNKDPKLLADIERLRVIHNKYGKLRLFCWCKPLPCHTDAIVALLNIEGCF